MDLHSSAVFEQFGFVKNYCTNEKISEWNANKVSTEERWVEVFKHFETKHVPFFQFSLIIEYVVCTLFSRLVSSGWEVVRKGEKIWKQESTALQIKTLKAILFVKSNMEYTCTEFHRFLKTRPDILRKISGQDKYDFKQLKHVDNVSPGAMSITVDSDDE